MLIYRETKEEEYNERKSIKPYRTWGCTYTLGSVKEDKKEYIDENGDKAPIPGEFCVVKDSEEDKNTVQNGLVISDVKDDDLDNSKHDKQFLWIPVNDYSKFHLIEGYSSGSLQTFLSGASNPSREAGDTATASSTGKPNAINSIAGTADNNSLITKIATDGSVKPLSQKGVGVWNTIPWGGTSAVEASDNLPGNDNSNGAVKVARSMYKNDDVHKVTSTLCYGVQWDAALNFIDPNYESGTSTGYVKDSRGKGNYSGSLATTRRNTVY